MQIVPMVATPDNRVMRTIFAAFSLDPSVLGFRASACPWVGLDAVWKIAAGYLIPAVLLLELALVLAAHRLIRWPQWRAVLPHRTIQTGDGGQRGDTASETVGGVEHEEIEEGDDGEAGGTHGHPHSEYSRYAAALVGLVLLMYEGVKTPSRSLSPPRKGPPDNTQQQRSPALRWTCSTASPWVAG